MTHPAKAGQGGLAALENLAALAEDINSQAIARVGDPGVMEELIAQRFGSGVSLKTIEKTFDTVRDLPVGLPQS